MFIHYGIHKYTLFKTSQCIRLIVEIMITKFLTHTQKIIKQKRDNRRFLVNLLIFSLIGISHVANASNQHSTTYTQSQIDSLVSAEVQRQIENQLELKIQVTTNEALNKSLERYISTEDCRLNFLSVLITIVALLCAIVAIVVPFFVNKQLLDEKWKDYKERMGEDIKESEKRLNELYKELENKLITQQNFSVSLIRALANKDEDVQLHMLNEMIREYADDINVCFAYNCRGIIYKRRRKYDLAISDYTKALEKNPAFVHAYVNRGSTYAFIGDYEHAIIDYNKAIELNLNFADVYYDRGYAYFKTEDYKNAIADYNKAIELNPNFAKVYYNRGLVYGAMGKTKKAKADYQKAEELGYPLPQK